MNNKIIGSGGCDYTDTIVPLDYVPEAFEFANRKMFHTWKMIGMQISHSTVGGIQFKSTLYDSSGRPGWGGPQGSGEYAKGISSGCLLIEEVNQNNHLIGRGANYFRAKSDASGIKSAAYGVMGHTNTPGIEWDIWNQWNGQNAKVDAFKLSSFDYPPIARGWGRSMGQELCGCASPGNNSWHMGVFIKDNNPTSYERNNIFLAYSKDQKCPPGKDPELCESQDSRLPGRFTAWADGYKLSPFRTCEALMGAGTDMVRLQGTETQGQCALVSSATFGVNDISGCSGELPFTLGKVYAGVTIKLTSLPTCNHFDKLAAYPPLQGDFTNRQIAFRCERAVLRILPGCRIDVQIGKASAKKYKAFEPREFHYDRWDRSDSYVGCYKIFDEVFTIEELNWEIRILAHHRSVLEHWADVQEYGQSNPPLFGHEGPYEWKNALKKQFLTGGSITGVPSGQKGCTCSHKGQNLNSYPVRPYNQFTYCPNDFTCEKTCVGSG